MFPTPSQSDTLRNEMSILISFKDLYTLWSDQASCNFIMRILSAGAIHGGGGGHMRCAVWNVFQMADFSIHVSGRRDVNPEALWKRRNMYSKWRPSTN